MANPVGYKDVGMPPPKPAKPGGRTGVSGQTTNPVGIGLQIEIDNTGDYWRYTVPGSGWYSPWNTKATPPLTILPKKQSDKPGGRSVADAYYDRAYGAVRQGGTGDFLTTMNTFGQPAGTNAPIQVRGPRGRGYVTGTQQPTPESVRQQLEKTEEYLQNEYDRLNRRKERRPGRIDHWDPLGYRLQRLQRRKNILQALAEQMGLTDENAGIDTGATGAVVRWNV